jgi:hypothetical protein
LPASSLSTCLFYSTNRYVGLSLATLLKAILTALRGIKVRDIDPTMLMSKPGQGGV